MNKRQRMPAWAARNQRERNERNFNAPRYTNPDGSPAKDPFCQKMDEIEKVLSQYRSKPETPENALEAWHDIYALIRSEEEATELTRQVLIKAKEDELRIQ